MVGWLCPLRGSGSWDLFEKCLLLNLHLWFATYCLLLNLHCEGHPAWPDHVLVPDPTLHCDSCLLEPDPRITPFPVVVLTRKSLCKYHPSSLHCSVYVSSVSLQIVLYIEAFSIIGCIDSMVVFIVVQFVILWISQNTVINSIVNLSLWLSCLINSGIHTEWLGIQMTETGNLSQAP